MKLAPWLAALLTACTPSKTAPPLAIPPLAVTHPIQKTDTSARSDADAARTEADHYTFGPGSTGPAIKEIRRLTGEIQAAQRRGDTAGTRRATKALREYLGAVERDPTP